MIKLYNDNCFEKIKEIKSGSVDLVIIDPPYLFQNSGGGGEFGSNNRSYHNQLSAIKDGFNFSLFDEIKRVTRKFNCYVFCNKDLLFLIIDWFKNSGYNLDILVWHKTNPTPLCNNKYLSDLEYILFIRESGVKVYGNYKTKSKLIQSSVNKKDKNKYNHPTIKYVEHIEKLIINSTLEGDTVLDCFMGSGTTGVACKNLNRKFIGIELDKDYFEIAKKRIGE